MKQFEYRPEGEFAPYGRQRVYFTCHPDDFDSSFGEISRIVWKKYDCTMWFYRDEIDDEAEYKLRLNEMQLFIIPITERFLMDECRARCFDLPFALSHNIPVLPLMMAPGLTEPFARICGDLHYIDRNACDVTTLTYEQKIHKFLSMCLISDELSEKIRKAFYTHIFLSYRKRDRVLADKLMRLIHDIPFCWDVAIWFDEYLIPGQSFNEAIAKAMHDSKLFVLCVTENLAEEGNYVRRVEYRKAQELPRPIMPVAPQKMTPEQMDLVKSGLKNFPDCIDGDDSERLAEEFKANFTNIAVSTRTDDPMHLFFIGLAYLNGIEVEVDHRRAADLIARAADQNYLPAMEKLAGMYSFGEGVARDPEKALAMYERLIDAIAKGGDDQKLFEAHCDLLRLLFDAGLLFRYRHMECVKSYTMRTMELAAKVPLSDLEIFKMYSLLAFVNEHDEVASDIFINAALKLLPEVYDDDDRALAEEAFFYSQLASLGYQRSAGLLVYNLTSNPIHAQRREQSEQYITKAIDLLQKLYEKEPNRWKVNYADALHIFCSMNYTQPFCDEQALVDAMEHAIALYRELCEDNAALYAAKLAALCRDSGDYLACEIDFEWEEVLDIRLDLRSESYVPGMPEQRIPLHPAFAEDSEAYDIRRMRKALSLMRYSAAVYEDTIANGQEDCWIDLAQTYFCLSRLLSCLAECARSIQKNGIEEKCAELLRNSFDGYLKMLGAMRKFASIVPFKRADSENKEAAVNPSSEEALAELERVAYGRDPFAECYNFALELSDNGLEREAAQLHEALYHFFNEVHPEASPALVLMNLYAYACGKTDVDEELSLLLEYDSVADRISRSDINGFNILFDYYCGIARCYMQKGNCRAADGYYAKAQQARTYYTPQQRTRFNKRWAMSKKGAGDLEGAEALVREALDHLMSLKDMPAEMWNDLSHEYASLLTLMGRAQEADAWLRDMLVD